MSPYTVGAMVIVRSLTVRWQPWVFLYTVGVMVIVCSLTVIGDIHVMSPYRVGLW